MPVNSGVIFASRVGPTRFLEQNDVQEDHSFGTRSPPLPLLCHWLSVSLTRKSITAAPGTTIAAGADLSLSGTAITTIMAASLLEDLPHAWSAGLSARLSKTAALAITHHRHVRPSAGISARLYRIATTAGTMLRAYASATDRRFKTSLGRDSRSEIVSRGLKG